MAPQSFINSFIQSILGTVDSIHCISGMILEFLKLQVIEMPLMLTKCHIIRKEKNFMLFCPLICFIWLLEQWFLNCKISLSLSLFFLSFLSSYYLMPNCGDFRTEGCLKCSQFNYAKFCLLPKDLRKAKYVSL